MRKFLIGAVWSCSLSAMTPLVPGADMGQPLLMTVFKGVVALISGGGSGGCLQVEQTDDAPTSSNTSLPRQYGTLPGQVILFPGQEKKRDY